MTERRDERVTKVYIRCEACGKIVRPEAGRAVPEGWIELQASDQFNARRAVCSQACLEKVEQTE